MIQNCFFASNFRWIVELASLHVISSNGSALQYSPSNCFVKVLGIEAKPNGDVGFAGIYQGTYPWHQLYLKSDDALSSL